MILVTLGTHEQPFERALDLVEPLVGTEELVVQHGHTPRRDWEGVRWIDLTRPTELRHLAREATAVVCHAGVGSIVTALSEGKIPVVLPRLRSHGEHVDDHQLQIAHEFDGAGLAVAYSDGAEIGALLAAARSARARRRNGGDLRSAVAEATRVAAEN